MQIQTQAQTQGGRMKARQARLAALRAAVRPGVRVMPKNDDIRGLLKHPSGARFRSEGSAVWPDDIYTFRRIQDGDIFVWMPKEEEASPPAPQPVGRGRFSGSSDD
jgi:hypothetical protein